MLESGMSRIWRSQATEAVHNGRKVVKVLHADYERAMEVVRSGRGVNCWWYKVRTPAGNTVVLHAEEITGYVYHVPGMSKRKVAQTGKNARKKAERAKSRGAWHK